MYLFFLERETRVGRGIRVSPLSVAEREQAEHSFRRTAIAFSYPTPPKLGRMLAPRFRPSIKEEVVESLHLT